MNYFFHSLKQIDFQRLESLSLYERISFKLARLLILNRVKKALGLDRVYFLATG